MKFFIFAAVCLALASAETAEEHQRKSDEILEENRRQAGHWIFLNGMGLVDHMVNNLGRNGLAVAGFFINFKYYQGRLDAGEEVQMRDPLFREFKKAAESQNLWLDQTLRRKTWSFGYSHDKDLAMQLGCDDVGTWEWNYACVVVWRSSSDGTRMQTVHSSHFGKDHSKNIMPSPQDIRDFIVKSASKEVPNGAREL
jgi:hypothetical protein